MQRRDFLNGLALALASPATAAPAAFAPRSATSGAMAGQHDDAMSRGHALRDAGTRWRDTVVERDAAIEDLVVVGAGLSGLAGAWTFVRHAGRPVRVLLLDALDEPGGHAQRNEFVTRSGRRMVGYGGSQALDSPGLFSPAVHELLREVGIDLARFEREFFDAGWAARHEVEGSALYFDPRHWSHEAVVVRRPGDAPGAWLAKAPFDAASRESIGALDQPVPRSAWPSRTAAGLPEALASITYAQFLRRVHRAREEVLRLHWWATAAYFGVGIDATSALDAFALGLPGFAGMPLRDGAHPLMSASARLLQRSRDDYVYHFPDGNAGVARAILRALRPDLLAGPDLESLVDARLPLELLDDPSASVRLRQRCAAVGVRHLGSPDRAELVEVRYLDARGRLRAVRARQVLLACWHRVIARLTDELPAAQRRALDDQVKTPLVYATVLASDWRAWHRAGIRLIRTPGGFWQAIGLDFPVSVGPVRFAQHPDEPMLLHFSKVVVPGDGRSPREQAAAGRAWLMQQPFQTFEDEIRRVLDAVLGPHGFDAERDLEAITLNRWAHGYACEHARPWDCYWPDGALPNVRARRGWGRVAIANSDSGAYAYAHAAIDQAVRAVGELLPDAALPRISDFPGPFDAAPGPSRRRPAG